VIKRVKDLLGISPKADPAPHLGRLITPPEPPHGPPLGPRAVEQTRPEAPPPRQADKATPSASWDDVRQEKGLANDADPVQASAHDPFDYRDSLDETFDSLDERLSGNSPRRSAASPPPFAPPVDVAVEPPVYEVDRDWFSDMPDSLDAPDARVAPHSRTAPDAPLAPGHRTAPDAPVARVVPSAPVPVGQVADAFESLFAAEHGGSAPPPAAAVGVSDAVVDRIATRVAERLSEGVFIDIVTQIVTGVAERLVREEIARIRAKAEEQTGSPQDGGDDAA
jgi:hypothetical protein